MTGDTILITIHRKINPPLPPPLKKGNSMFNIENAILHQFYWFLLSSPHTFGIWFLLLFVFYYSTDRPIKTAISHWWWSFWFREWGFIIGMTLCIFGVRTNADAGNFHQQVQVYPLYTINQSNPLQGDIQTQTIFGESADPYLPRHTYIGNQQSPSALNKVMKQTKIQLTGWSGTRISFYKFNVLKVWNTVMW